LQAGENQKPAARKNAAPKKADRLAENR